MLSEEGREDGPELFFGDGEERGWAAQHQAGGMDACSVVIELIHTT